MDGSKVAEVQTALGRKLGITNGLVIEKIDLDQLDKMDERALRIIGLLEKVFYLEGRRQADMLKRRQTTVKAATNLIKDRAQDADFAYSLWVTQREHLEGIGLLAAGITDDVPQRQRAGGRQR